MQGLYWGMLHPFTSGPQILLLIALSLFVQQRLPESENTFNGLCIGCLLGAGAAASGLAAPDVDVGLVIGAIVVGTLVTSALGRRSMFLWAVGVIAGLLCGYTSWPEPGPLPDMLYSGAGAIIGSIVIIILVAGGTELIWQKTGWPWISIAVRVVGSWTTAIAVLLGALLLRNNA